MTVPRTELAAVPVEATVRHQERSMQRVLRPTDATEQEVGDYLRYEDAGLLQD